MTIFTEHHRDLLRETYRRALYQTLNPVDRPPIDQWANDNCTIPKETRGSSSPRWEGEVAQNDVMQMMVSDRLSALWWMKSARSGATKMLIWMCFYVGLLLRRNILGYFPNDEDRDDFVRKEYDPAVRDNPVFHPAMRNLNTTSMFNNMSTKMLFGCMQQFYGGFSEGNFRGKSPDIVFADEASAFQKNIGRGGSLRSLMTTRVTRSVSPKEIGFSSPASVGCQVSDAYAAADVKLQFHVPCPNCAQYQVMECQGHEATTGVCYDYYRGDYKRSAESARYVCDGCGDSFKPEVMKEQLKHGFWMDFNQEIWWDRHEQALCDQNGVLEGRYFVGLQSNILVFEDTSWVQYIHERLEALRAADAGDHEKWDTFRQTRDGRPTDPRRVEDELMPHEVLECAERYPANGLVPERGMMITTFTDCHKRRFETMTVLWGSEEESWLLAHHIIQGDITKASMWKRLKDYLKGLEYYRDGDGTIMKPFKHGIDYGGHWTDLVVLFCKQMGIEDCIPFKGELGVGKAPVKYPKRPTKDTGVYLTMSATDPLKQIVQTRLQLETQYDDEGDELTVQPGKIHIPEYDPEEDLYSEFDLSLIKEFTSEVRIVKGKQVIWDQRSKNEGFDCLVGNLALARACQTTYIGVDLSDSTNDSVIVNPDNDEDFLAEYEQALKNYHGTQ